MNREHLHHCSDIFSVDLDEGLETGTLAFALADEVGSRVTIRLPARDLVALRDALNDLSEDPADLAERRFSLARPDDSYSFLEEDLGEIRRRESDYSTA